MKQKILFILIILILSCKEKKDNGISYRSEEGAGVITIYDYNDLSNSALVTFEDFLIKDIEIPCLIPGQNRVCGNGRKFTSYTFTKRDNGLELYDCKVPKLNITYDGVVLLFRGDRYIRLESFDCLR